MFSRSRKPGRRARVDLRTRQSMLPEALEARRLLAVSLAVNFQPGGAPIPSGYVADTGLTYANRGNGFTYGWNSSNTIATRDRNNANSIDQRYDTLTHTQAYGSRTWELAVPNGQYQVTIVAGDPSYFDSVYRYNAENTLVVSGTPTTGTRFFSGTSTVTVGDGRLTLSNAIGASNNKICFVQINSVSDNPPALSVPGTIQAEDFDNGGAGVSYHDTTSANLGGKYRNTAVDIVSASEGGYAIGYTRPDEWLNYTVNVGSTGSYNLELRVASSAGGLFQVSIDGQRTSNVLTLPSTGGWQTWKTISYPALNLAAGTHTLGLHFGTQLSGSGDIGNINWLRLSPGTSPTPPTVNVSASDTSAAEPGSNTGKFTFTRSGSTASSLTIGYTVSGSATNGVDYNTLGGSITIPAGASSATLTVTPKDDNLVEGSENVRVTIKSSTAYQIGTSNASVNIADNDAPTTGAWPASFAVAAELPRARQEARGATMDGKVWVFGGFYAAATYATQQIDYYDVAANTWTTLRNYGPMPHSHSATVADPGNHAIYFVGGLFGNFPGDVATNRVFRFNTQTQAWSEPFPALPEALSAGGAAIINGELHYVGGSKADRITDSGRHLVLDLSNPSAGWRDEPALPNARTHFSTAVVGGKMYIIGGQHDHEKHTGQLADVHRYDPVNNTWTRLADLPTPKSHAETSTFVRNGRIIMAGGQVGRFDSTDEVVSYDPATNQWTQIGKLPKPLSSGFVQLSGNTIIVTIGNHGDGPSGETWVGEL